MVIESGQDIWFAVYRKDGGQLEQVEAPRALTTRSRTYLFENRDSRDIIVIADDAHKLTPDLPENGNEGVQIVVNLPDKHTSADAQSIDEFRKTVVPKAPELIKVGAEHADELKN